MPEDVLEGIREITEAKEITEKPAESAEPEAKEEKHTWGTR